MNLDEAAPSEVHFLIDELQRLALRKIPVVWAGSATDGPANLAGHYRLPGNVMHLSAAHPEAAPARAGGVVTSRRARLHTHVIERGGVAVARVAGLSRQKHQSLGDLSLELPQQAHPLFTIGLLHIRHDEQINHLGDTAGFDYWALGGRMSAYERPRGAELAPVRFAGSPVGRTLEHTGNHGCTLVQVDEHGIRPRALDTATATWHLERVEVNLGDTLEAIEMRIRTRCQQLTAQPAAGIDRIVTWRLFGPHAVLHRARVQNWDLQLTERLQQSHGLKTPAIWSRAVELQPAISTSAEDYPAGSLTNDYLRTVASFQAAGRERLDLQPFAKETVEGLPAGTGLPADVTLVDRARDIAPLLSEAAMLGAEYLQDKEAC